MGTLLLANGIEKKVFPMNGCNYSLTDLQSFVGGYIEIVRLSEDKIMVVNEEGLLHRLPYNYRASHIVGAPIVGDVLVCKRDEVK